MAKVNITFDSLDFGSYTFDMPNGIKKYDIFYVMSVPSLISGYNWYLQKEVTSGSSTSYVAQSDLTFTQSGTAITITVPGETFSDGTYGLLQRKSATGTISGSNMCVFTITSQTTRTVSITQANDWHFIFGCSPNEQQILTITKSSYYSVNNASINTSRYRYVDTGSYLHLYLLGGAYGGPETLSFSLYNNRTSSYESINLKVEAPWKEFPIQLYVYTSIDGIKTRSSWYYGSDTKESRYSFANWTVPALSNTSKPPPSHLESKGFYFSKWAEYVDNGSGTYTFNRYMMPGTTYGDIGGDDRFYTAYYNFYGAQIKGNDGVWHYAIPYIYKNGWKRAEPYMYHNNSWKHVGGTLN